MVSLLNRLNIQFWINRNHFSSAIAWLTQELDTKPPFPTTRIDEREKEQEHLFTSNSFT